MLYSMMSQSLFDSKLQKHTFHIIVIRLNKQLSYRQINNLFMNKHIFLVFLIAITAFLLLNHSSSYVDQEFLTWKEKFAPIFEDSAEQFYRKSIFASNLLKIKEHNADPSHTYKMGVNQFTIYTQQEFQEIFLNDRLNNIVSFGNLGLSDQNIKSVIIDWNEKGAVGPVRNQGSTGSVSEIVALEAVEGLSKVSTGTLQAFSIQQLTDCLPSSQWVYIDQVYNFYIKNSVCTEQEYPLAPKPQKCQGVKGKFKIVGFTVIMDCSTLKQELLKQPIAVIVDATNWSAYSSGIFSNCKTNLNHLVLLTGLTDKFWKVKNSWGTSWGEKGYMRLAPGNTCGLCNKASYPKA